MSNYFINYDASSDHLSINTFRNSGFSNSDILQLVGDIKSGLSGNAPLEGVKDALEDGSLWGDEDESIINQIHNLIQEHEAEA